jgi:glycosyltransferase involved in cell wall biosynthesis
MRVAIVHEWLDQYAGSERVLEQLLALWPNADLYAIVDFVPKAERAFLGGRTIHTSFIQRLPFARKYFRNYLGLMPLAVEQFDMSGYNLIISSNHAVAKGVVTGPNQVHVSYVHSPMRYAWDLQAQYLRNSGLERGLKSTLVRWLLHRLRLWDRVSADGVDVFVANSNYIAGRIRKVYRREAVVVPPPVSVDQFQPASPLRTDTVVAASSKPYLVVSRFVPYKRVEMIVQAFANIPDRRLVVVGSGECANLVIAAAAGAPNIELRPPVSSSALVQLMQNARALVFAAEEDFGITMVEAQACGAPVIAFGKGGACDIVADETSAEPTGVLFHEPTPYAIEDAVERFEAIEHQISAVSCRQNAMRFSVALFQHRFSEVVTDALSKNSRLRATASSNENFSGGAGFTRNQLPEVRLDGTKGFTANDTGAR